MALFQWARPMSQPISSLIAGFRRRSLAIVGHEGGNTLLLFALVLPIMLLVIGGGLDVSMAVNERAKLQSAADAVALAVSIEVAKNPNDTLATLQSKANTMLIAELGASSGASIASVHVCAPIQNDCTNYDGSAMATETVEVRLTGTTYCAFGTLISGLCNASGGTAQTVNVNSTTAIGFSKNIQLNILLDGSASMIVGATSNDVTLISNWVSHHWNSVKPGDPYPYNGGDNPPCAFACHDIGGSTTSADIVTGLTNAHTAGATTRFDVMISAAQQLLSHIQTEITSNSQYSKNTYMYNVMSFDTTLHSWGSSNMLTTSAATSAVNQVTPGLDTYMSTALSSLITTLGQAGSGVTSSTPLKFLIIVTDGLQSDRNADWYCNYWGWDSNWNYNVCYGGYATTISATQCNQLKSNGVVVAVLETPYVPLTGQDPNVAPYERVVRSVIYPNGPNGASALSTSLQACASSGYYFQATNSSQIATGFTTLTDKFLASVPFIKS